MPPTERNPHFARLLEEFGVRLRAAVQAHCRPQQGLDPDDIEQEVRIRLWKALERDQNAAFNASYIQRVVVSTVIDALRRAAARPMEALPEADEAVVDWQGESEDPARNASDSERMRLLQQGLEALPERRRVTVQLHLQGFRPAEIATLQGLTLDATRKLIERGMLDLRTQLNALGLGDFDD